MAAKVEMNGGGKVSALDGAAPDSTDFSNYFCTYAFLYHQKDMLEDHKRTGAYYQAVMQNRRQFEGRVVLDVGTGSGILAVFAAKAGARKVYAVEATNMAKFAKQLVASNNLGHVVEVIQGTIETVELPEKVDIIISEWMGYFLLRESMLDSVLHARDRFLKPGGALYPSHARMYLGPIRSNLARQRLNDFQLLSSRQDTGQAFELRWVQNSMEGWADFVQDMNQYYGVRMDCLSDHFHNEQRDYYLQTSAWVDTHPSQMLGPASCFKRYDLATVSLEELSAPLKAEFSMDVFEHGPVEGFCGFFDVQFCGSKANPADYEVLLSTAPDPTGSTHWGQQSFVLHPTISCAPGDRIVGDITIVRKKENHRLMEVQMHHSVQGPSVLAAQAPKRVSYFHIE